ncbi:MAG: hypothetical protein DWQ44_03090 [Bacteroidetes bacterium]|nr:MAG: hypothetical protein DWQ33_04715 [Bacteroidota bacterium]REK00013.1 MAG: hypothetical protein DWQ39_13985 [Bacteroidota bacterium]REK35808.1 MAG: hypothetical protein DWQ44_03090 [Bacteroidota bacterium]REK49321.1 MAG: hypothetical protein DWQ48_07765 [Bacteroidota bacterium]
MQNQHFISWTETFTQNIMLSTFRTDGNHVERFIHDKLNDSVIYLNKICKKMHESETISGFYNLLCVYVQETKNCLYWYERSLDYELADLNNSRILLNQGKSMLSVLEATLKVINLQEKIN